MSAKLLDTNVNTATGGPVIGICATCDPRIDKDARQRAQNIIKMAADIVAGEIKLPSGDEVPVVFSDVLIDTEKQADIVARQFKTAGVNIIVCVPDTWAFPQPTFLSLIAHFSTDTPLNFTCGNSAPRPGVVYTHAISGAVAQTGRLLHINVGSWADTGLNPVMTDSTKKALIDWLYAAITRQALKGKRVVTFGHDSMGMETALGHVIPTRNTFGIEITRLDMKLLADMIQKEAYDKNELKALRNWIGEKSANIELRNDLDEKRFQQSLALYLITRDIIKDLDGVGGGFMSQLEWGSDLRGLPLPVADAMESLFNSTFDHNGPKTPIAFATENDIQGLLTMLFMTYLSGGNPPLFMDLRKVWESWEITKLAQENGISLPEGAVWHTKGFIDGNNSGSASFDWAAKPGASIDDIMKQVSFPLADEGYFPGMGNSVTFRTPGEIQGIAARLSYSALSGMFSMIWDEAETFELPNILAEKVSNLSNVTWPHTFLTPKHASMNEYKHYAPANHLHMTWNLPTSRLQYWMDLANVISATPWAAMPTMREGIDRPLPLLYVLNGGETNAKMMLSKKQ